MLWPVRTPLLALPALTLLGLMVACTPETGAAEGPPTPDPGEYLPGLSAQVDLPEGDPAAVVVLVPGGGWSSADPTGLRPLAVNLTEAGLAVVTITYETSATGDYYPRPVDDVACAGAYAAVQVPDVPVVLVGHSAGAHLVVMAGLRPDRDDVRCQYPEHAADGVVGLAGPYDVSLATDVSRNLFGVPETADPGLWRDGNPFTWAEERPDLPFLLAHGESDSSVAVFFTTDLAAALIAGGHEVAVELLPDVTHLSIFEPDVIGGPLVEWISSTFPAPA